MNDRALEGRNAVVTGAGRGIGAAIAERLALLGANVAIHYHASEEAAAQLAKRIIERGGDAALVQADLATRDAAQAMVSNAVDALGSIDILVNNAGIAEFAPFDQIDPSHLDRQMRVNFESAFWVTQAALPSFPINGGRIVNIGSVAALNGPPGGIAYAASKAALIAATRILSKELGPRGTTVNSVSPGPVETDLLAVDLVDMFVERTPLGRIGAPSDIASVVAFLASEEGGWVTGQDLAASGGFTF